MGGVGLLIAALLFRVVAPAGAALTLLLGALGGSLSLAAGGVLEVEVVALEVETGAEFVVHVHGLDVVLGEGLHGGDGVAVLVHAGQCTFAGDGGREAAQVAERHGVAFGDGLLDAVAHVGDDAYDGALGVDAVVVGHVGGQGVDVKDAVELQASVRLLGLFRMSGVLLHVQRVLECVVHKTHPRPLGLTPDPSLSKRGGMARGVGTSTVGGFRFKG